MFASFQDCKEFQGELFGICNLFRDLSDKLFTSEILELHERRGQQHGHQNSTKQDLTDIWMSFVPPKEASEAVSSGPETSEPKEMERPKTPRPMLEDMGECICVL